MLLEQKVGYNIAEAESTFSRSARLDERFAVPSQGSRFAVLSPGVQCTSSSLGDTRFVVLLPSVQCTSSQGEQCTSSRLDERFAVLSPGR